MVSVVRWMRGMTFLATGESGHAAVMDAAAASGGDDSASSPKEMLLHAMGGCTGMDVVLILRKMQIEPRRFEVEVRGELEEEPPRAFRSFHLDFRFEGEGLPLQSLERAVSLSQERYCSVSLTLGRARPITWAITVNGQTLLRKEMGDPNRIVPPD